MKKISKLQKRIIIHLYNNNFSINEIASAFNYTSRAIYNIIKQNDTLNSNDNNFIMNKNDTLNNNDNNFVMNKNSILNNQNTMNKNDTLNNQNTMNENDTLNNNDNNNFVMNENDTLNSNDNNFVMNKNDILNNQNTMNENNTLNSNDNNFIMNENNILNSNDNNFVMNKNDILNSNDNNFVMNKNNILINDNNKNIVSINETTDNNDNKRIVELTNNEILNLQSFLNIYYTNKNILIEPDELAEQTKELINNIPIYIKIDINIIKRIIKQLFINNQELDNFNTLYIQYFCDLYKVNENILKLHYIFTLNNNYYLRIFNITIDQLINIFPHGNINLDINIIQMTLDDLIKNNLTLKVSSARYLQHYIKYSLPKRKLT